MGYTRPWVLVHFIMEWMYVCIIVAPHVLLGKGDCFGGYWWWLLLLYIVSKAGCYSGKLLCFCVHPCTKAAQNTLNIFLFGGERRLGLIGLTFQINIYI